tara:strand:- start:1613 stop:1819 length:207 start_codon:yes stop_codon:yes gene_type:complete
VILIALGLITFTAVSHTTTASNYQGLHAIMAVIVIGLIARHARDAQAFYIVLILTFAGIAHGLLMAHS